MGLNTIDEQNARIQSYEFIIQSLHDLNVLESSKVDELYEFVVTRALQLSSCTFGFLGFLENFDQDLRIYSFGRAKKESSYRSLGHATLPVHSFSFLKDSVIKSEIVKEEDPAKNDLSLDLPASFPDVKNFLCLPHLENNKVSSVLFLANKKDAYSDSDIANMRSFMEGIWRIMEQKESSSKLLEAQRDLRASNLRLKNINRATQVVLDIDDFSRTAQRIFDRCKDATGATVGFISLISEESGRNEVKYIDSGKGVIEVKEQFSMPLKSEWKKSLEDAKVVVVNNFNNVENKDIIPAFHMKLDNLLFGPLILKGTPVGIIGLGNKQGGFTEGDIESMDIFREIISLALRNARHMEEQIKAGERARQNKSELEKVQKLTQTGSWYLDIASQSISWTRELYRMFDLDPSSPAPPYNEHSKLFTPESWSRLSYALEQTRETGNPYEVELQFIKKNGNLGWMWVTGELVKDQAGNKIGLWGAAQDISERKNIENQLLESKLKAEESNRLKSEFLNNMSHEVRTPLNGIMGFSKMLEADHISTEKKKTFIKIINDCSNQLLRIIDDILEISILETNQQKIAEERFSLIELVDELYALYSYRADQKNLAFYIVKPPVPEDIIVTDRRIIIKILENLLDNAIKFTNEGSIEFGYRLRGKLIEFYVKDTGIGIAADKYDLIFDRFSQEDKSEAREYGGLGLGLSISRENANLLEGDVSFTSQKGKGSTFFLTVPYKPVDQRRVQKIIEESTIEKIGKQKVPQILLVEDEMMNALYVEELLNDRAEQKIQIHHAKNGEEAIIYCRENPNIDLILMDLKMPGMNGFEATEKIKQFMPDTPIIAQTAYSSSRDEELALASGCNAFITKPIEANHFLRLISKYLNKKKEKLELRN